MVLNNVKCLAVYNRNLKFSFFEIEFKNPYVKNVVKHVNQKVFQELYFEQAKKN